MRVHVEGAATELTGQIRRALNDQVPDIAIAERKPHAGGSVDVEVIVDVAEPAPAQQDPDCPHRCDVTLELLRQSSTALTRYVLVSSVLVYAPQPSPETWPIREHFPRRAHGDPASRAYGQACIEVEDCLIREAARRRIGYVILRPTALHGGGGSGFTAQVMKALAHRPWMAASRYEAAGVMQWLDIRDAADAVVRAVVQPAAEGHIVNLAGIDAFTSHDLARWMTFGHPRALQASFHKFDTTKAEVILGWSPSHSIAELSEEDENERLAWASGVDWP